MIGHLTSSKSCRWPSGLTASIKCITRKHMPVQTCSSACIQAFVSAVLAEHPWVHPLSLTFPGRSCRPQNDPSSVRREGCPCGLGRPLERTDQSLTLFASVCTITEHQDLSWQPNRRKACLIMKEAWFKSSTERLRDRGRLLAPFSCCYGNQPTSRPRAQFNVSPEHAPTSCTHLQLGHGTVKLSRWRHWLNFIERNGAAPRAAKSALQRSRLYWQLHQLWKSFELHDYER